LNWRLEEGARTLADMASHANAAHMYAAASTASVDASGASRSARRPGRFPFQISAEPIYIKRVLSISERLAVCDSNDFSVCVWGPGRIQIKLPE